MQEKSERIIPTQCIYLHDVLAWARPKVRNCPQANEFAMFMLPYILILKSKGITGPSAIAKALNEQGYLRRNLKPWNKVEVFRLLDRLGPTLDVKVEVTEDFGLPQVMKALGYK